MRGIGSGCEIHNAREEGHDTNCIEYKMSARILPLESLAKGCSGAPRAPPPARPWGGQEVLDLLRQRWRRLQEKMQEEEGVFFAIFAVEAKRRRIYSKVFEEGEEVDSLCYRTLREQLPEWRRV